MEAVGPQAAEAAVGVAAGTEVGTNNEPVVPAAGTPETNNPLEGWHTGQKKAQDWKCQQLTSSRVR